MAPFVRAAALVLIGLSGVACSGKARPNYVTQPASRGDVADVVTATGQIEARVKVNVGSQVSGTLQAVHVTWNDTVKAGDVLAELDPRLYAAQLARAAASVEVAEASVVKARVDVRDKARTYARTLALHEAALVALAELQAAEVARDQAHAALAGAAATLTQAKADRDQAQANLAFTKIRSPIDGVVLDRQVDAGQTVAAQFQVATLFVIAADMHEVQVVVSVDEADVGKLHAPLAAEFRVAAYPQQAFAGEVTSVRPAPTSGASSSSSSTTTTQTSAVVTYAAVVEAKNPNNLLRQGMTAELTVVVNEAKNVVRVPAAALRWSPAGEAGPSQVYVLQGGRPELRQVRLGLGDGQFVAVLQGLEDGEAVVVGDASAAQGSARGRGPF